MLPRKILSPEELDYVLDKLHVDIGQGIIAKHMREQRQQLLQVCVIIVFVGSIENDENYNLKKINVRINKMLFLYSSIFRVFFFFSFKYTDDI